MSTKELPKDFKFYCEGKTIEQLNKECDDVCFGETTYGSEEKDNEFISKVSKEIHNRMSEDADVQKCFCRGCCRK